MIPVAPCKDTVVLVLFKTIHSKSMCFHDRFHLSGEGAKKLTSGFLDGAIAHWQNGDKIYMRVRVRLTLVNAQVDHSSIRG